LTLKDANQVAKNDQMNIKNLLKFRFLRFQKAYIWIGIALLSFMLSLFWFTPKTISADLTHLDTKQLKSQVKSEQFAVISVLKNIMKKQAVYRIRVNRFASQFSQLGIPNSLKSKSYNYQIVFSDESRMLVTARAKRNGLKSYIGGAAPHTNSDVDPPQIVHAICGTNQPSMTAPNPPIFNLNRDLPSVNCPPQSMEICATKPVDEKDKCY